MANRTLRPIAGNARKLLLMLISRDRVSRADIDKAVLDGREGMSRSLRNVHIWKLRRRIAPLRVYSTPSYGAYYMTPEDKAKAKERFNL